MRRSAAASCLSIVALGCLAIGCGGQNGPTAYPVKGIVKLNGQPVGGASLAFYHVTGFGRTIIPTAISAEDGTFVLSTYKPSDGAPAGDYEVAVTLPSSRRGWKVGEDTLGRMFADPKTSQLKAHVEPKSNELPPIELQVANAPSKSELPRGPRNKDH